MIPTGPKYSEKKPVPVPFYPPQISHALARDRTRASAVVAQRRCTNARHLIFVGTRLHVTLLGPRILRTLLHFWNKCAPMARTRACVYERNRKRQTQRERRRSLRVDRTDWGTTNLRHDTYIRDGTLWTSLAHTKQQWYQLHAIPPR